MEKKWKITIIILIIVLLFFMFFPWEILFYGGLLNYYERYTVNVEGEQICEDYYEECRCFGLLIANKIYPPQYECTGFEKCSSISRTVCRER